MQTPFPQDIRAMNHGASFDNGDYPMSKYLSRLISPLAAMVAIMTMGMVTPARADLEIWLSETNNPPVAANVVASGTTSAFFSNGSFAGNLNITTTAGTTSPGTPTLAQTTSATTTLINTSGSNVTVFMTIGSTGFTAPAGNVSVASSVSATVAVGDPANTLAFNSYINGSNGQNVITGTTTASPQSLNITATTSGVGTATTFGVSGLGTPYSMTERYQITLSGGSSITLSSSTVVTPIPEPSTMALAGLGTLGLVGYGLRRRRMA
jgi:hypothetical protein